MPCLKSLYIMKRIFACILVIAFCLFIAVSTVSANARWYVGEQFNKEGKTVTREGTRTGNFSNGYQFFEKYTEPAMTMQLKGEKKGILGIWSTIKHVEFQVDKGIGSLNNQIVDYTYETSGTNTVRVSWIQASSGHLAAYLRFP